MNGLSHSLGDGHLNCLAVINNVAVLFWNLLGTSVCVDISFLSLVLVVQSVHMLSLCSAFRETIRLGEVAGQPESHQQCKRAWISPHSRCI